MLLDFCNTLFLFVSTSSKSLFLPDTRSTTWTSPKRALCFLFREPREFYDLQVGEGAWFTRLTSSRGSETASLERRKCSGHQETGADTEAAREPGVRLPFGPIGRNLKLRMIGRCLSLCKAL